MQHRRHPVEKMCRMTRTGIDCCDRRVVVGTGVTERDAMSRRGERSHEVNAARQFRRHGHDTDVGAKRGDDVEDVTPRVHAVSRAFNGSSQAIRRLRTFVFRIDEVAFKMGRQYTRGTGDR